MNMIVINTDDRHHTYLFASSCQASSASMQGVVCWRGVLVCCCRLLRQERFEAAALRGKAAFSALKEKGGTQLL
jgi:hypothetical protein